MFVGVGSVCNEGMWVGLVYEFVKDHQLSYKAVDVDAYSNLDNDTWSYYEALALVICLGYQCSQLRLWWKLIEVNFEDGLKQFSDDKHALELEEYAVNNNGEANLYVEHLSVNQPQYISYEELLQLAHAFLDEDEGERNGAHVDENDGAEVGHEDVQHVVQMLKLVLRWRGEEAPKGGTDGGVGPYENDVVDDGGSQNVVNESGDVVCHNENGADNVMSTGQFEDEDDSFSPSTSKASDEDIDDDTEFVDDMGSADNTGACLAHFAFDLPNMDDVGDDVDANYMSEELDNGSKSDEDGNFRPRRSIGIRVRRKEPGPIEWALSNKVRKIRVAMPCRRCDEQNHNVRTCKKPAPSAPTSRPDPANSTTTTIPTTVVPPEAANLAPVVRLEAVTSTSVTTPASVVTTS
ncbi:hypothetical protein JHK87_030978 [Glycine soja]|nr:hypothetical protein JHK87_030978 [Glycine soja]